MDSNRDNSSRGQSILPDRKYNPIHEDPIKLIIHNIRYAGHADLYFYSLDDPKREPSDMSLPAKHTSRGVAGARKEVIKDLKVLLKSIQHLYNPDFPVDESLRNLQIYKKVIEQKTPIIDVLRKEIGVTIFTAFDLAPLFIHLWKKARPDPAKGKRHLMILTNDMEIPWGWATNPEDPNVCLADKYSIGYITPEDVASYEERMRIWDEDIQTEISDEETFAREKASSRIMIAVDSCLEGANQELADLKALFEDYCFDSKNILTVCSREYPRGRFLRNLIDNRKLRIVHFAGHVTPGGNIKLADDHEIEPESIRQLSYFEKRRFDMSCPLVFLNGCASGKLIDPYRKSDQLSTAFASIGAIACVTTRFEVQDLEAAGFANHFYKAMLGRYGITAGAALSKARSSYIAENLDDLSLHHVPYFYCLYGNPAVEIFPRAPDDFDKEAMVLSDRYSQDVNSKDIEERFSRSLKRARRPKNNDAK
jgi:hypothetical protein